MKQRKIVIAIKECLSITCHSPQVATNSQVDIIPNTLTSRYKIQDARKFGIPFSVSCGVSAAASESVVVRTTLEITRMRPPLESVLLKLPLLTCIGTENERFICC